MSFRFTVSLFEADRDAGSPDAADITAILRKSEREPVVLSLSDDVFPAYAGMIPNSPPTAPTANSVPRICGDDPVSNAGPMPESVCSPHMRG